MPSNMFMFCSTSFDMDCKISSTFDNYVRFLFHKVILIDVQQTLMNSLIIWCILSLRSLTNLLLRINIPRYIRLNTFLPLCSNCRYIWQTKPSTVRSACMTDYSQVFCIFHPIEKKVLENLFNMITVIVDRI